MSPNIWRFTHTEPLARITFPSQNDSFLVGEMLTVKASIQDVREATLYINNQAIETKADLTEREVVFSGYTLTNADAGNLNIRVRAQNGQGVTVTLPSVQIRVAQNQVSEPYVWLFEPYEGDSFDAGDTIRVSAFVESVTQAELRIGNHRQQFDYPFDASRGYNITFDPYTFTAEDAGDLPITVTGTNSDGQSASDTIVVQVERETLNSMMENLANDTTLIVSSNRRNAMTIMGQALLDEGYEPAFVAGMLANIMSEGSFGLFENSNYSNIANRPAYFQYFIDNHNYAERLSNRVIYDVDITPNELYEITSNSPNQTNIFGLGVAQWTHVSRFFPLVRLYIETSGGGSRRITRAEVIEAETRMMIWELGIGGSHHRVYRDWQSANSNINSEEAAFNAAHILCLRYLIPLQAQVKAIQRGNDARVIFRIMTS